MALEMRGGCGPYYTRSVRRNGRVVREYLGSGPAAVAIAQLDQLDRERRQWERFEAQQDEAEETAVEEELERFCAAVEQATRTALQAAGFRQHHRGEWRRRRGGKDGQGEDGNNRLAKAAGGTDAGGAVPEGGARRPERGRAGEGGV